MGDWFGIPEWLAKTAWVAACLSLWFVIGLAMHWRQRRRLTAKRRSPTREAFVALLSDKADADIAEWLWEQLLPYYRPLTPHPDDYLRDDASIDDDDIDQDWRPEFVRAKSLADSPWPDWPAGWDLTVANYARWLQLARDLQAGVAS
jgi:hypothetical protein